MLSYLIRRILMIFPIIFGILFLTFLIKAMIPTDAVSALFSGTVTEDKAAEAIAQIRAKYNLDLPWYQQFGIYVWDVMHLDLGESVRTRRPVTEEIGYRYVNTLILTFAALVVAIVVGLVTGMLSAYYKDTWIDVTSMSVGMMGISMPAFFFGFVLIFIFSVQLRWLPVIGRGDFQSLILPALTLGFIEAAALSRITRSSMLDVLSREYVRTARAKGMSEGYILFRHALPNAFLSILTIIGLQIGNLLGGAFIIEVIFGWHGIGELAVKAIQWRDFTITQAVILVSAGTYVLVNLVVDLLYTWIDPRIDYD
ncbi:Glutathione transport system permease protein GsiC [Roseobacter fucihabitans]|uniref:Glutathione transport system permease protein GsiC n=1 Tax=Roseobacter fucihabitans TaxID=1537242 RepID=A0ABZ2BQT9_9RHOB|nr:ABC transporter permease [Roseobacter litoralis]MBC6968212.1 Glutathione transport system permease protein GsiC [Roseobacter litoralis]